MRGIRYDRRKHLYKSVANSISKDDNLDLDNFSLNFLYVMDLSSLGTQTLKRNVLFSLM